MLKLHTEDIGLKVHPNPASREVAGDLPGFEKESAFQIRMTDMAGNLFNP